VRREAREKNGENGENGKKDSRKKLMGALDEDYQRQLEEIHTIQTLFSYRFESRREWRKCRVNSADFCHVLSPIIHR